MKTTLEAMVRAVLLYVEGTKNQKDICSIYGISDRTLRRWVRAYKIGGLKKLAPKKPGPVHNSNCISRRLELKITTFKQKHPSWGARRIKFQH